MPEIDEIRMRKLAEMQARQQGMQQKIQELEGIVRQLFTKEALERYGNIKAVDRDRAVQVIAVIGQMVQSGRVHQINDEMLKNLLARLAPEKKQIRIKRV